VIHVAKAGCIGKMPEHCGPNPSHAERTEGTLLICRLKRKDFMEFFEYADILTSQEEIRNKVSIDTLPLFCEAVEAVDAAEELGRVIYFRHWGRFHLQKEDIMGGVRFSVPDCPNALAWTVTTGYPPYPEKIVLHGTINRLAHDPEFIAATQALLATLKTGLEANFTNEAGQGQAEPRPIQMPDLRG